MYESANDPRTANNPQIGRQMIPYRKRSDWLVVGSSASASDSQNKLEENGNVLIFSTLIP